MTGTRTIAGWVVALVVLTASAASAQTKVFDDVDQRPVVILNPAHEGFVIPPFWVEGKAEPGEKLGVFINGYQQFVVTAGPRGNFLARVAWAEKGPVWIEVRRGDERSHKIQVRVAEVSPPATGARLSSDPGRADPVVRRQERAETSAGDDVERAKVYARAAPTATYTTTQRVVSTLVVGYMVQSIGLLWGAAALLNDPADAAPGLAVAGAFQASSAYVMHRAMGHEASSLWTVLGAALPTLLGVLGTQTNRSGLAAAGFALQPVGATLGATF